MEPIAENPFRVKHVETLNKTVVIEREDRFTENGSQVRVNLVSMTKTATELVEDTGLQKYEELGIKILVDEDYNINQLV